MAGSITRILDDLRLAEIRASLSLVCNPSYSVLVGLGFALEDVVLEHLLRHRIDLQPSAHRGAG